MAVLKTDTDDLTKRGFARRAKAMRLSESELLRQLVLAELGKGRAVEVNDDQGELDPAATELKKMTIRLPAFIREAVDDRAKGKGMVPSRWVASLVQCNVTKTPVMTDRELVTLRAANRELAAIGRNVNQIAKHLNSAFYENERASLDSLQQVPKVIESAKRAIRDLVKASKQGWAAGDE